jgi:hypothetical protein
MDAAFFQPEVLRLLAARGCTYAIKVGYSGLAPDVTGFEHLLVIPQ